MMLNDPYSRIVISSEARNLCHSRLRDSRFPHMCRALLRFPHQSFMPLEPYLARYARHLPHAGKALSVAILFPHMCVFALTLWGKRFPRIVAFSIGEGGPRQQRSGTFVNCLLETISPALFHHAASTLSGSLHSLLSPWGKAWDMGKGKNNKKDEPKWFAFFGCPTSLRQRGRWSLPCEGPKAGGTGAMRSRFLRHTVH